MHCSRRIVCTIAALLLSGLPAATQEPRPQSRPIEITAQAIDAFDSRDTSLAQFGTLRFRGGLVLTSSSREFGGISAIRMLDANGRFIALTDRGKWLRARIVLRDSRPIAIADAEIAPILGPDGKPVTTRRNWYDTEALADDGGTLYVGIERSHEILRFDYGRDGLLARGQPIGVPPAIKSLPSNRGIECLVAPPKGQPLAGTLIAISERGLDPAGNILGFLLGPQGGTFTVKRNDEFDISDCALTPRGDLLLLERRFSWIRGLAIRIRRVPLARVAPRSVLEGSDMIVADMGYQIDNFEGMAVHRDAAGALVLTLISDDNFSPLQRTLLMQFTLLGE